MVAEADELIAQAGELVIQLLVVGLAAVLLQGVHDGSSCLLTPHHQTLLDCCQRPQGLQPESSSIRIYWGCKQLGNPQRTRGDTLKLVIHLQTLLHCCSYPQDLQHKARVQRS